MLGVKLHTQVVVVVVVCVCGAEMKWVMVAKKGVVLNNF
jgi:hypothetical protein